MDNSEQIDSVADGGIHVESEVSREETDQNQNVIEDVISEELNNPGVYQDTAISPEFVRKMLDLGPCQPGLDCNFDFPKTNGR